MERQSTMSRNETFNRVPTSNTVDIPQPIRPITPEMLTFGQAIERKKRFDQLSRLTRSRIMRRMIADFAVKLSVRKNKEAYRRMSLSDKRRFEQTWRNFARLQISLHRNKTR